MKMVMWDKRVLVKYFKVYEKIGKYESNYPLLEEGISKLREALELIVDFGMKAQNPLYPNKKLPEGWLPNSFTMSNRIAFRYSS